MDQTIRVSLSENQIDHLAQLIAERVSNDNPADGPPDWLTKSQAAKLLGISISSLEKRTQEGVIPGYKIGSCRRYKRAELLALVPASADQDRRQLSVSRRKGGN